MSQFYTNPDRESDAYSLPNAEVFYAEEGEWAYDENGERTDLPGDDASVVGEVTPCEAGWYWWPCFPGCLPDGEPMGPFATEEEAIKDAQSNEDY